MNISSLDRSGDFYVDESDMMTGKYAPNDKGLPCLGFIPYNNPDNRLAMVSDSVLLVYMPEGWDDDGCPAETDEPSLYLMTTGPDWIYRYSKSLPNASDADIANIVASVDLALITGDECPYMASLGWECITF